MIDMANKIGIIACKSGQLFAKKVCDELIKISRIEGDWEEVGVRQSEETTFANGEIKTVIKESIRGQDIFLVQDIEDKTNPSSINDKYMALKTAIDSIKRADANSISVVLPAYPYSRQDKSMGREGVTASLIAQELENFGIKRVITLDIHNTTISGFFRTANIENLHASHEHIKYIKENYDIKNMIVVSPDTGGVSRARVYAEKMQLPLAIMYKQRDYSKASTVDNTFLLGEVDGKDVLIVDDMIATGGTTIKAIEVLKQKGAKKIYFACALPIFSGKAAELLSKAHNDGLLEEVIGTDAVTFTPEFMDKNKWFKQVSVAKYFARVIFNLQHGKGISYLLK